MSDEERRLLVLAWSALGLLMRCGLPLDPDWPLEADEAYEKIGEFLWPTPPPVEREAKPPDDERIGFLCHACKTPVVESDPYRVAGVSWGAFICSSCVEGLDWTRFPTPARPSPPPAMRDATP